MNLSSETVAGLSPGVRELVVWLNQQGFWTVDSGDGSNHRAGMEGAMPFPMVAIKTQRQDLIAESVRLYDLLKARGVDFTPRGDEWPQIQCTYDPFDDSSIIVLFNVLSRDVGL